MGESIFTRKGGGVELTGNATTDVVFDGYTFYSNNASNKLTGTFAFTGNAATTDVATGKTFYATNGTKLTGTGSLLESSGNDATKMNFINNTATYGGGIRAIAQDSSNIYVVGASNQRIRKFNKNNLAFIEQSNTYGGTVIRVQIDNDFVYIAGTTNQTVQKFHKSNLVYVGATNDYGSQINGLKVDNDFIYAGGIGDQTIKKWHKGNLAYIGATNSYGGWINDIEIDDTFVYAVGDSQTINKWFKSNLTYNAKTNSSFQLTLYGVAQDSSYVYCSGFNGAIEKYHKGNMAYVSNLLTGTNYLNTITVFDNTLYAVGAQRTLKVNTSNMGIIALNPFVGGFALSVDSNFVFTDFSSIYAAKLYSSTPFVNASGERYWK